MSDTSLEKILIRKTLIDFVNIKAEIVTELFYIGRDVSNNISILIL